MKQCNTHFFDYQILDSYVDLAIKHSWSQTGYPCVRTTGKHCSENIHNET